MRTCARTRCEWGMGGECLHENQVQVGGGDCLRNTQ